VAYDLLLQGRVQRAVADREDVSEKRMFGGVAFLLDGKMFCGIAKEDLMVRVGPERHAKALGEPHVRPMDFTGRPMKGYVYVGPAGVKTDKMVERWVKRGLEFVATVEAKAKPKKKIVRER
jgi:TfoX/Sxy family transcriptional regulator of competence genes